MKYFFILGNNPTLSTAEISAVFPGENISLLNNILIINSIKEIDAKKIIKTLGGTIKIGTINYELKINNEKDLLDKITKLIDAKKIEGKFKFGFSNYGGRKLNLKKLGMELKNFLKGQRISCRWVTSREPVLSSVVVEQNKLAEKGLEVIILKDGEQTLIGKTLAVQPFKELSFRDYGRPGRDDHSGMLPPKLAQIMINLTSIPQSKEKEAVILDPFCGSGTILTEAILMRYKNIIGSDLSKKAVADTTKNINWVKNKFQIPDFKFQIYEQTALGLAKLLKPGSVDAIVTEPYLGPQRGEIDFNKTKKELEELYSKSLLEFKKILKPTGRIVMVWPEFRSTMPTGRQACLPAGRRITPNFSGFKIINPIPENLIFNKSIQLTNRNTIIYGRPGQKVWREIVVLRSN